MDVPPAVASAAAAAGLPHHRSLPSSASSSSQAAHAVPSNFAGASVSQADAAAAALALDCLVRGGGADGRLARAASRPLAPSQAADEPPEGRTRVSPPSRFHSSPEVHRRRSCFSAADGRKMLRRLSLRHADAPPGVPPGGAASGTATSEWNDPEQCSFSEDSIPPWSSARSDGFSVQNAAANGPRLSNSPSRPRAVLQARERAAADASRLALETSAANASGGPTVAGADGRLVTGGLEVEPLPYTVDKPYSSILELWEDPEPPEPGPSWRSLLENMVGVYYESGAADVYAGPWAPPHRASSRPRAAGGSDEEKPRLGESPPIGRAVSDGGLHGRPLGNSSRPAEAAETVARGQVLLEEMLEKLGCRVSDASLRLSSDSGSSACKLPPATALRLVTTAAASVKQELHFPASPCDSDISLPSTAADEKKPPSFSAAATSHLLAEDNATKIWAGDESFVRSEKAAEYLGKRGERHNQTLECYMKKFDFRSQRLEEAFRALCSHLYLKAESQQIDRILAAFSQRYHDCNQGLKASGATHLAGQPTFSPDEIHTVVFSLLLLNTDLHVAGAAAGTKMSRGQYVRNTLGALSIIDHLDENKAGKSEASKDVQTSLNDDESDYSDTFDGRRSTSTGKRWSMPWGDKSDSGSGANQDKEARNSQVTAFLKDVYNSVSRRRIEHPPWAEAALVGASPTSLVRAAATVRSLNALRSQSPGGGPSSSAGVVNSPLDGQSPGTVHDHPSPGVYSTLSPTSRASLSSSLGALFAFGLRHSASTSTVGSFATVATGDVFDKESLGNAAETSTAGNVKEGLLIRKHLLERTNKQATSRSWKKSRAVLQNAELMLYNDSKHPKPRPDLTLCLLHAVATALPGVYSHDRKREHVFAINLFNGGAYLLQAPTAAECADWIAKANLEAARRSREPLGQGVTNFDFGWGRVLERLREEEAEGDADGRPPARPFSEKDYDIREWKAPEPNVEAVSGLSEGAQLESLTKRLGTLEEEIEKHHRLREKMQRAIPADSKLYARAMGNFERRAQYLLREHVKYSTYADVLKTHLRAKQ